MSLLTIALFALGYLVVVLFVLALLRAAKRADESAEREYEALARSLLEDVQVVRLGDRAPVRERARRRRTG